MISFFPFDVFLLRRAVHQSVIVVEINLDFVIVSGHRECEAIRKEKNVEIADINLRVGAPGLCQFRRQSRQFYFG